MQNNPGASYSGEIDWNAIYRTFYQIDQIEERIESLLTGSSDIVFCGFGELAHRLSTRHTVHFVEYSEAVAKAANNEFPSIRKVSHANILDAIKSQPAPVVLVVCRISAYWQSPNCLERFLLGVRASSRDLVAIDFFDAEKLEGGESLGNLSFSDIRTASGPLEDRVGQYERPSVLLADVRGSYRMADKVDAFSETRAYYQRGEVLKFAENLLPEYGVSIEDPIIDSDPGFTLMIRSSGSGGMVS